MALFCLGKSDIGCVYLVGYNSFLAVSKKPYIITLVPALFMTCVCSTYICIAPEGLGLSHTVSYGVGIACVMVATVWFYIWINKQKTRKLSE